MITRAYPALYLGGTPRHGSGTSSLSCLLLENRQFMNPFHDISLPQSTKRFFLEFHEQTCDPGHLHVVDDAHKLVKQPDGQVSVFEAVDGQTTSRLGVAVLQVGDDAVMHVLFLLLKNDVLRKDVFCG